MSVWIVCRCLPSVWVKPEIVIEVLADEITRSPIHTAGARGDESPGQGTASQGMPHAEDTKSAESMSGTAKIKELGYALRFPRLVRFRDNDKRPEDATTVTELIRMYKGQGKQ